MGDGISIQKISADKDVQEALRALDANRDGKILKAEVDADNDGLIDCNQATHRWMYTTLGPVENALFKAGLVTKLRNSICRSSEELESDFKQPYTPRSDSPYYQQELAVVKTAADPKPAIISSVAPTDKKEIQRAQILIVPDTHGDIQKYNFVKQMLENGNLDWFAIEMIPHDLQQVVDTFIQADIKSAEYKDAESVLIRYFGSHWNDKFGDGTDVNGLENPYFKLIQLAKSKKVRVICMDCKPSYYMENPQQDMVIVGTRNRVWSEQIPSQGRGLVFGGRAHFEWYDGVRVQDFLAEKIPPDRMRTIKF